MSCTPLSTGPKLRASRIRREVTSFYRTSSLGVSSCRTLSFHTALVPVFPKCKYKPNFHPVTILIDDNEGPLQRVRSESPAQLNPEVDDEDVEFDDDASASSSRWEASEELSALLSYTAKRLSRFERRSLTRCLPRPKVDAAFTPVLDDYLKPMIPNAKSSDEAFRDIQDKILDTLGIMCTMYENLTPILEAAHKEGSVALDAYTISGDTSAQISTLRRETVLTKLNPMLSSLGKEEFRDTDRQLFGQGLEQRLKIRSEAAETISKAAKAGQQPFRRGSSRGAPCTRKGSWRPPQIPARPSVQQQLPSADQQLVTPIQ